MSKELEVAQAILGLTSPLLGAVIAISEMTAMLAQAQAEGRDLTDEEMVIIRSKRKNSIAQMNAVQ